MGHRHFWNRIRGRRQKSPQKRVLGGNEALALLRGGLFCGTGRRSSLDNGPWHGKIPRRIFNRLGISAGQFPQASQVGDQGAWGAFSPKDPPFIFIIRPCPPPLAAPHAPLRSHDALDTRPSRVSCLRTRHQEQTHMHFIDTRKKSSERLTADEEKDLARKIRAAEERARQAIEGVDVAMEILTRRPERAERTRAGAVDRLEQAVEAVWRGSREFPELKQRGRDAKTAWAEAEALRWQLAMSGRRIAHGEARKLAGPFMDEEDLVQEGYIGLLRAAKRFDPDRDIRFSTYARWWVRAQMTRAIDHTGRPVRLPGCAVEQTRNLRKAIKRFEAAGISYGIAELAEEVGIDKERAELLLSQGSTISLEQPVDDGPRPRSLERFLSDTDAVRPDGEAIQAQELARMHDAFEMVLTERHRFVLTRRYGLQDGEFRTLSEVGKEMGLSRERVRQIEREALIRLREQSTIREGL